MSLGRFIQHLVEKGCSQISIVGTRLPTLSSWNHLPLLDGPTRTHRLMHLLVSDGQGVMVSSLCVIVDQINTIFSFSFPSKFVDAPSKYPDPFLEPLCIYICTLRELRHFPFQPCQRIVFLLDLCRNDSVGREPTRCTS